MKIIDIYFFVFFCREPLHRRSSSLEAGRSPVQYDSDGQIVRPNGGGRRLGKSPRGARTPRTPRQDDEHALLDDPEPYDAATAEQTKKKKKKKKRRKSEEGGDDGKKVRKKSEFLEVISYQFQAYN